MTDLDPLLDILEKHPAWNAMWRGNYVRAKLHDRVEDAHLRFYGHDMAILMTPDHYDALRRSEVGSYDPVCDPSVIRVFGLPVYILNNDLADSPKVVVLT